MWLLSTGDLKTEDFTGVIFGVSKYVKGHNFEHLWFLLIDSSTQYVIFFLNISSVVDSKGFIRDWFLYITSWDSKISIPANPINFKTFPYI